MKRFTVLFLAAALLIPTALHAEGPILIGTSFAYLVHPVHAAMKRAAEKTAASMGVKVVSFDAYDSSTQESGLQDFITYKVTGILVTPITTDSLNPVIEKAVAAGILVGTVDRTSSSDKVLFHIGVDDVEGGRMAARYVIEKLGNKGTVIELEGSVGASPSIDRKKGFDEVIGNSNVKILASQSADFYGPTAFEVMSKLIKVYPSFDALFAANDDMILGAFEAMSAAGIDPSKKVTIGWDASVDALAAIKQGKLGATVEAFPGEQASQALAVLVDCIKNKKKPEKAVIYVVPKLITEAQ
jgi:ribose transport system substrate-binding protein